MSVLTFSAADVKRVVEHTIKNKQSEIADWSTANEKNGWTPARSTPAEPHIVLVHDEGVYLMSNGTPRDLVNGKSRNGKVDVERSFAAYAKGCDPVKDADNCWDMSRAMVGGDDFGEYLPWAKALLDKIDGGAKTVRISVAKNQLKLL